MIGPCSGSAVVIGASASGANPGRIILKNLKQSDGVAYGHLWAVHPRERAIDGVPCVPSVAALPEKVDLAVVSVPATAAAEVVAALADGKAESIILIPGGFGEAGRGENPPADPEGAARTRGDGTRHTGRRSARAGIGGPLE